MKTSNGRQAAGMPAQLWPLHRDGSLNWLALGLLLAAWNAVDDGNAAHSRPGLLRGYPIVSVRAATRSAATTP